MNESLKRFLVCEGDRVLGDLCTPFASAAKLNPNIIRSSAKGAAVAFTGIALTDDAIIISFPKGSDIARLKEDTKLAQQEALLLMKALIKYKTDNPLEASCEDDAEGDLGSQKLYYAFQIVRDYIANGLVKREKSVTRPSSKGNIVWQKTISRSPALHFSGGVIYQNPYSKKRIDDSEDTLRLIQKDIVGDCLHSLGWLFSIDVPEELKGDGLSCSKGELLAMLAREKISTFSQRELTLIDFLTGYLRESASSLGESQIQVFGSLHFELIWESACKVAFGDDATLQSKLVPQPKWRKEAGLTGLSYEMRARQIPDVLSINDPTLLILDAKYYDTTATLPGWHDIVKQIYYQDTIERRLLADRNLRKSLGIQSTVNAFLFPGKTDEGLHLAGNVNLPDIDDGRRWGRIDAYIVDLSQCLNCYVSGSTRKEWIDRISIQVRPLPR